MWGRAFLSERSTCDKILRRSTENSGNIWGIAQVVECLP
jgi:hypothetical protein